MPTASDDLRHPLRPGPFARESLFYSLLLPDEGLMVFVYTWVGATGAAGHLVVAVTGEDDRRAISAMDGLDVGEADFDDWTVGGLHLRHTELLKTACIDFTSDELRLDLEYSALHDAFSYRDNADGCPSCIADDRFELSCRVRGTVEVDGRTIEVDTTGHRDHSWGTRDWDVVQDWKWISGQAQDGTAFNVMRLHAGGDDYVCGYVLRDGVVVPAVDVRAAVDYDARWWQEHGEIVVVGQDGRTTTIEVDRYAMFCFEAGERTVLHEAACTGTVDGVAALVHFECGWDKHYAALQVARATAASAGA